MPVGDVEGTRGRSVNITFRKGIIRFFRFLLDLRVSSASISDIPLIRRLLQLTVFRQEVCPCPCLSPKTDSQVSPQAGAQARAAPGSPGPRNAGGPVLPRRFGHERRRLAGYLSLHAVGAAR